MKPVLKSDIRTKLVALGLTLLLAACGSQTPQSSGLTPQDAQSLSDAALADLNLTGAMLDGSVSSASLKAGASAQGVSSLETAALSWNLPPRVYALLRDLGIWIPVRGTQAAANCTIVVTSSSSAPQYVVSFDCSGSNAADTRSYTTKGELDLTLQNGTDEAAGFTAAFKDFDTVVTFADKSSLERKLDGSLSLDKSAVPWKIAKNYTHSVTKKDTSGNTVWSGQNVFSVSKTYQPDSLSAPGMAGTVTIDQATPGSDVFTNLLTNKTHNVNFYTNPTVHWNSACTVRPRFDAGEKDYIFTDAKGVQTTLSIKFSGCGNFTISFNGGAVPISN
ncbi:MAG: hypothetical protein C4327_13530 [Meiothermus sp.]